MAKGAARVVKRKTLSRDVGSRIVKDAVMASCVPSQGLDGSRLIKDAVMARHTPVVGALTQRVQ